MIGTGGDPKLIDANITANIEYAKENNGKWMPINGKKEVIDLVERAKNACRRCVEAGEGSEDFRHICELIANYGGWGDANYPDT
jgi:hypothetical protein